MSDDEVTTLTCARRLRVRPETWKKLQAMLVEEENSDATTNINEPQKKKAKVEEEPSSSSQEEYPATPKRKEPRKKFIPETPEEKLIIKEEQYTEIVKQTPMGKLRHSRRRCRKLTELLQISEKRIRPLSAATVASEQVNRAIMSTAIAPNITKEVLFALHTPTARPQRTARANLIDRFVASPSASSSTPPKKSRMTDSVAEEPERKKTRSSVTASPPAPESSNGIRGLEKEQILESPNSRSLLKLQKRLHNRREAATERVTRDESTPSENDTLTPRPVTSSLCSPNTKVLGGLNGSTDYVLQ